MVAIVAGNSLGLSLTSFATLGQDGIVGSSSSQGRNGEQVWVNSETGNLVVQGQDEYVAARGLDISGLRTYNSQAKLINGSPDSWGVGPMRLRLALPVTWGAGTMTRTDVDGAEATYGWDGSGYATTMGVGAYDRITKDIANNQYIWTDGGTQNKDYYDSTGKLLKTVDADNNAIVYGYDASGRLSTATGANGEIFKISYTSSGDLQDVTTTLSGGTTKRVTYGYDTSHRLTSVMVDLTPADGSTVDGASYWTNYSYVGSTSLINTITQKDQTSLTFTYDTSNRVKTVTAGNSDGIARVMTFTYDSTAQTTITDPAGASVVMQTDASGRLSKVQVAGQLEHSFTYSGTTDDVWKVTDGANNVITYGYDAAGNLQSQSDSLSNGVTRTYNAANQILTETIAGGSTANYIYPTANGTHAHYVVSGAGRVTEYLYDSYGQRSAMLAYDGIYTGARTESAISTWTGAQSTDSVGRTDYTYSPRGQLASITVYGAVTAAHAGDTTAQNSQTTYTYNTQGQLLSSDVAGLNGATSGVTTYGYDGMGRQVSFTNTLNQLTIASYDDANNKTTVTFANGLVTTSTWDKSGNLISVLTSGAVAGSSTSNYAYDANNRPIMTSDGTGVRTFQLYDGQGRIVGDVDGDGSLTEYMYDGADRLTRSVKYTTAVPLTSLFNSSTGKALNPTLASIRPASQSNTDKNSWRAYDITGRLLKSVDEEGSVTEFTYDSASRLVQTKRYANALTQAQMNALGNSPAATAITPTPDATNDRVTRNFYDADDLLIGALDAAGYLQQLTYDGVGRLVQTTCFATLTTAADRASGSFATLQAQASAGTGHEATTYLYDAKGQRVGVIDPRGYLTEYGYDIAGRVTSTKRYFNPAVTPYTTSSTIGNVRPVANAQDISTSCSYDDLGRPDIETDARLTTTKYSYDAAGNLTQKVESFNVAADTRSSVLRRYDELGRLTQELSAQNYALGGTDPWTKATKYTYDAAGRRIAATDPAGKVSYFYYDNDSRLVYSVDSLGGVVEYVYNALDNNTAEVHYQKAISTTGLTGGLVTATITNAINAAKNAALDWRVDYTYTRDGKVSSTKDANGYLSYAFYDAFDEPIYTVDAAGGLTANKYDNDGRLVQTTRYVNKVLGVTGSTTVGQLQALVTSAVDGSDQVVNRVYDMDGRLTATVNGLGEVVKFKYDGNGNVVESRAYVNRLSGWMPGSAINTVDTAADRRVRTLYDAAGRAAFTVDGFGAVVTYKYDLNGNVLERRAYATSIDPSLFTGSTQVLPSTSSSDQLTTNLYDSADRLQWSEDGTGAVTRFFYDDDGNVTQKVEYASKVTPGAVPSTVAASTGNDRITNYLYDTLGRQTYVVNTAREVTGFTYDNNGNVTQRREYNKLPTSPTSVAIGTILSSITIATDTTNDRVTRMAYDAENRLVFTVDSVGAITENVYDGCGNVTKVIEYANLVASTPLKTLASTVTAIRAVVTANSAADRATNRTFYADNSLKTTTDGLGHVTTFVYDGIDQVKSVADSGTGVTTRTTAYVYDGAGRLNSTTDALNNTESYGYDGVGNKVSFTNKKNATWTYQYDAAGRLIDEFTPVVDVFTMTEATMASPTLEWVSIQTHYTYDALNLLERNEAYNQAQGRRKTSYEYDGAGRQIRTVFPSFAQYSPESDTVLALNGQGAAATRSEATSSPYSETYYDAFGQATGGRDVGGKYSYKVYDVTGNLLYDVDAVGYVTGYVYDHFGGATSVTRYLNRVTPPVGAKSLTATQAKPTTNASNDRVLTIAYDNAGRTLTATEPSVFMYDPDRTTPNFTGAKSTSNTYNAFGQLIQTTSTRTTAASATEYRYYDKAGNLTATVDAGNFVTAYTYDVLGNLTQTLEYRKAYTGTPGATAPTPVLDAVNDRTTTYTYDLLNRKKTETRKNVQSTDQETFVTGTSDVVATFGYDAVGNQISVTTAAGTAYTYYDVIGRVNAMTQPARAGEVLGTELTPLTVFRRDVYGNAILTTDFAQGATFADETTYSATASDPRDRTTFMLYDVAGHLTHTLDAAGGHHYASYDAFGHKVKEWQSLGTGASTVTIFKAYKYDELGRVVQIRDPASNAIASSSVTIAAQNTINWVVYTDMTYNGFGEMTMRTVTNATNPEYWDYDVAGRLWRTNADGGVDKIYLYDQLGRRTAELQSAGNGWGDQNVKTGYSNASQANSDTTLRRTDYKYDLLGRVIQETLPGRQESYSDVNVRDTSVTATIVESGSNYTAGAVSLSWNPLANLGDGDIKVVMQYMNLLMATNGEGGSTIGEGFATSATVFVDSDAGNTGTTITLPWNFNYGGVSRVDRVTVYKMDASGNWVLISDHAVPETTGVGNTIVVEKMAGIVSEDIQIYDNNNPGLGWVSMPQTGPLWHDFGSKLLLDLRSYDPPSRYQFRLQGKMANGTQTVLFASTLDNTTSTYAGALQTLRPSVNRTFDRWGNVLSISDPRNAAWVTTYEYNANNQMVKQSLPLDASGAEKSTLATTIYYDKLGRQVGVRDANNNLNRMRYDTQGNLIEEIHADGGDVVNLYDIWGRKISSMSLANRGADGVTSSDDAWTKDTYTYNNLGLLTDVTHWGFYRSGSTTGFDVYGTVNGYDVVLTSFAGTSLREHTDWDAAGRKIAQYQAVAGTETPTVKTSYQYDLRGNVIRVTLGGGAVQAITAYDFQDRKSAEMDGNGVTATWAYDYFGRVTSHKDIGGATTTYTYDNAKQLKALTGTVRTSYFTVGQNIAYSYDAAGQLTQVNDNAIHQTTSYTYDWSGNKTSEQSIHNGVVVQDNHLAYDALGRLRVASDDRASITFTYDLVGNRTRVVTHVLNTYGLTEYSNNSDRWFKYDAMNRQTVVDGVSATTGAIDATQGHQLTYDLNGNRLSDTYYGKVVTKVGNVFFTAAAPGLITERYAYDGLNRLVTINRDDGLIAFGDATRPVGLDSRCYDRAGRVVRSGKFDWSLDLSYFNALYGKDANGKPLAGNGTQERYTVYDDDGRVRRQQVLGYSPGATYNVVNQQIDGAGNLITYRVDRVTTPSDYTTSLIKFEGYKEEKVTGTSSVLRPGTTNSHYDVNGFLISVDDPAMPAANRSFVNDLRGQVLQVTQGDHVQREFIVNGEVLARYGSGVDSITPRKTDGTPNFNNNIGDFLLGFRSITPSYPAASPGMYTVQNGDSLRTIAKSAYGDGDLWYEIAEANGIGGDAGLRVGMSISIPNVVNSRNSVNTFTPYDPSEVVGDTTPYLAPPPKKNNFFAKLVMIVVAVVAAIFTAGAALAALAPELATAAATMGVATTTMELGMAAMTGALQGGAALAAAAVGGAVGSIASQVVGIGLGVQESFSWKGVALSAGSAGITSGIGSIATGVLGGSGFGATVGRAVLGNLVTQGIGVVTGVQKSFDWRGVAASAAGSAVGYGVNEALRITDGGKLTDSFSNAGSGEQLLLRSMSGIAAGTAAVAARGGRVVAQQVATDAFGNALGSSLVENMNDAGRAPVARTPFPMVDDNGDHVALGPRGQLPTLPEVAPLDPQLASTFQPTPDRYSDESWVIAAGPTQGRSLGGYGPASVGRVPAFTVDAYADFELRRMQDLARDRLDGLSGVDRAKAHALGAYDAVWGTLEAVGNSYGVVGTPQTRAEWATRTVDGAVAGISRFVQDPSAVLNDWWDDLTGDDPNAIRQATAQGTGALVGAGGAYLAARPPRLTIKLDYTPLAGREVEFMRQLAGQEAALNKLSPAELQTNIEAFNANGRPAAASQAVAEFRRENPVSTDPFAQAYLAQAPAGMNVRLAALHEPDMVIGGPANAVAGYGDFNVNSSIGAQNRYHQAAIYDALVRVGPNTCVRFVLKANGR